MSKLSARLFFFYGNLVKCTKKNQDTQKIIKKFPFSLLLPAYCRNGKKISGNTMYAGNNRLGK